MQAAGSVDHPLPPQSDASRWGRATCGRGRVTGGEGQSLPQSDTVEIQMGGMMSQWMSGITGGQGKLLDIRGLSG